MLNQSYKINTGKNKLYHPSYIKQHNITKTNANFNETTKLHSQHNQNEYKKCIKRNSYNYPHKYIQNSINNYQQISLHTYRHTVIQNSKIINKSNKCNSNYYLNNNKSQYQLYKEQQQHEIDDQHIMINRFSDIKNSLSANTHKIQNCKNISLLKYKCQNHINRHAQFYVCAAEQEHVQQTIHYYCIQCAINLSQMNFNVIAIQIQQNNPITVLNLFPKYPKYPYYQPSHIIRQQQQIHNLISYKTFLNIQSQILTNTNQQNIQTIQQNIKKTQQKYQKIIQLLEQIKNKQVIILEKLKLTIWDFIANQEKQINGIRKKIEYLIQEYEKNMYVGRDWCKEQGWKQLYEETYGNIRKQFQGVMKVNPKFRLNLPVQISIKQIVNKIQQLFITSTQQLSYDASIEAQSPPSQKISIKSTKKIVKNPKTNQRYSYLQPINKNCQQNQQQNCSQEFSPKIQKQYLKNKIKFNTTFGKISINNNQKHGQIIQGIDIVNSISMSAQFGNQQNFMINI